MFHSNRSQHELCYDHCPIDTASVLRPDRIANKYSYSYYLYGTIELIVKLINCTDRTFREYVSLHLSITDRLSADNTIFTISCI